MGTKAADKVVNWPAELADVTIVGGCPRGIGPNLGGSIANAMGQRRLEPEDGAVSVVAKGTTLNQSEEGIGQRVADRIQKMNYLPTSVAVAIRFIELGRKRDVDATEYARVICSDSGLCAKLLSLANSSWFGIRNQVTRPIVAINLLGLGTVRTLATSYCLTGLHNSLHLTPDESRHFWMASLCKAVAARQYASLYCEAIADEAFTAGLLQDVGLPIMFAEARQVVSALMRDASMDIGCRLAQEAGLFDRNHAEVGDLLSDRLGLPACFVEAICHHHDHALLRRSNVDPVLADAVYAASLFPHALSGWNRSDAAELADFLAKGEHGPKVDVRTYLADVQQHFDKMRMYLEQGDPTRLSLEELLEEASSQVADATTQLLVSVQAAMHSPMVIGPSTANCGPERGVLRARQGAPTTSSRQEFEI